MKTNKIAIFAFIAVALFVFIITATPLRETYVVLNGAFVGCLAAIAVAYWRLFFSSLLGIRPFDRVRQMTIGVFLCWVVLAVTIGESIFLNERPTDPLVLKIDVAIRYTAIWAAGLQVTAPDFGLGVFHGRDRKTLWLGLLVGLALAVATVYMQQTTVVLYVITTVISSAFAR